MPSFEKLSAPLRRLRRPAGVVGWFVRPGSPPGWRRLRWRVILGLAAGIAVGTWLAGAITVYGYARFRRGVVTVRFADVALPHRWDRFRTSIGEHQLDQAARFQREHRLAEALMFARAGLARAPAHRDGRILAARLLQAAGRPDDALRTLREGLAFHPHDPTLLADLLQGLWQRQEDREIIALARRLVPGSGEHPETPSLLLTAAGAAALARGNFDEAEDLIRRDPAVSATRAGRHLEAKIDWERGLRSLALVRLRQLASENPADPALHRDLADWLRTTGQTDEARRVVLSLRLAQPDRPEPRRELIREYHAAGDTVRRDREIESYLDEFPADPAARLALADFAASAGDPALALRLTRHAGGAGWETATFDLLVIEAQIESRDYPAALDAVRALRAGLPDPPPVLAATLGGLLAIAHQGLGDAAASRTFLAPLLQDPRIRSATLLSVARRLDRLGAAESARLLLVRATQVDPLDQAALSCLVELDLAARRFDGIHDRVKTLLGMRRPSPDLLLALRHELGGDRFLFSTEATATLAALSAALSSAGAPAAPR